MKQTSYVMVKPSFANNQKVVDYVKQRLQEIGLEIKAEKQIRYTREAAQKHYAEHFRGSYENAKGFYKELEDYIVSDVAYGMEVIGEDAIARIREIVGSTMKVKDGEVILPAKGTIRYEVPVMLEQEHNMTKNVIHASDCEQAAQNELEVFAQL